MPTKPSSSISNDKIYDLINTTRLELKGDIGELRRQFDNLEAGRLTRAEGNINDLRVELQKGLGNLNRNEAVLSTKVLIIWSIGGAIFILLSELLLNKVFK